MNETIKRLSVKEKIGYSLGDTASHFVWDMVGFWLLFFYTDIYGISAAAAGTIMLIARFWDMAIDPVIGVVSDRTKRVGANSGRISFSGQFLMLF